MIYKRWTMVHFRLMTIDYILIDIFWISLTGNQSVLVYATLMGSIVGWDLRSPGVAWKLDHNLRHGKNGIKCGLSIH